MENSSFGCGFPSSRLTYEATSEAAEAYARRAEKADPEETPRPRRRRRRSSAAKQGSKEE